ncbi:DUF4184 family protein [Paenibacillus lemnae]|uniref:DUF4184 family protein n=1 Tax=Paenibacillus lemnae TaxID=1330551 RepID=A0A848M848_PAELE|nr:DUF4184 family protein [Paenibacillus lemnae]NMO96439.1 DUF4184 family protein [Paenibacillus lemnae]
MPFTFAHPVYAAPLKYIRPDFLSLTGLVLGSMSPDFEYFLMLEPYQSIGHSLTGLLIQAIPLSILFAWLFHHHIKKPLSLHLPSLFKLDRRAYHLVGEWRLKSMKDWIVFLISVIIGFYSHIVIDAFTHVNGYAVQRLPFLGEVMLFQLPLYKLLQYGLSLAGLLALVIWILIRLSRSSFSKQGMGMPTIMPGQKISFWLLAFLIAAVVTVLKLTFTSSTNRIGILVVAPISGLALGLAVVSWTMGRKLKAQEGH